MAELTVHIIRRESGADYMKPRIRWTTRWILANGSRERLLGTEDSPEFQREPDGTLTQLPDYRLKFHLPQRR